jgi:OmpA-OmpF porin, OOP family
MYTIKCNMQRYMLIGCHVYTVLTLKYLISFGYLTVKTYFCCTINKLAQFLLINHTIKIKVMVIKKYTLLAVLLVVFGLAATAQSTEYDWKDSSKVPTKAMPLYNDFLQNKYPYPPKPRNAWELGFSVGTPIIASSVKGNLGYGGGITLRKAISHVFSLRAGYFGYITSGDPNASLASSMRGYRAQTHMGSVDAIASLNTISSHRGNPKWDVYALAGYSLVAHRLLIDSNSPNNGGYSTFYGQGIVNSQAGTITTVGGATVNNRKAFTLFHAFNFGGGLAYKINNKINIGFEQRFTASMFGYDYLEGRRNTSGSDMFSFTSLRLNINLGN